MTFIAVCFAIRGAWVFNSHSVACRAWGVRYSCSRCIMGVSSVKRFVPILRMNRCYTTVHAAMVVTVEADVHNKQAVILAIALVPSQSSVHLVSPCDEHLHNTIHVQLRSPEALLFSSSPQQEVWRKCWLLQGRASEQRNMWFVGRTDLAQATEF